MYNQRHYTVTCPRPASYFLQWSDEDFTSIFLPENGEDATAVIDGFRIEGEFRMVGDKWHFYYTSGGCGPVSERLLPVEGMIFL